MNLKQSFLLTSFLFSCLSSFAQSTYTIKGQVLEEGTTEIPIIGATVRIISLPDSSVRLGAVTDIDGHFLFNNVSTGQYRITISYIGTIPHDQTITIQDQNRDLGTIRLRNQARMLDQVLVQGQQIRVRVLGDTTEFNAGAFKTNPDASAEDLLTKMPGVTTEGGQVKVQGEEVRQVLVDGKPFFGDDPSAALKNLPAEIIDRIQVFERLSDQAQFTGFDDGQGQKSINIITKNGKNTGQFGKVYAGYGADDRYSAGGNINFFNGDQRISVIGLSNNINQQNFSTEDLMGVTSGGAGGGGRMSGGRPGGGGMGGGRSGGGGGNFRGGGSDFLVGAQGGITQTNSIGVNYSDAWGKKVTVSGSYFFNTTRNTKQTNLDREYFTSTDSGLNYKENSNTKNNNANHRVNFRFNYTIDSSNSILITPRLSIQDNTYTTNLTGQSYLLEQPPVGNIINKNSANNLGYNFSNNILYRHKFAKRGRTLSINLGTTLNSRDGESEVYSLNEYGDAPPSLLDQHSDIQSKGYTLSGNVSYTEPISPNSQVLLSYSPSFTQNKSDKETFNADPTTGAYTVFDTLLSNQYDNTYTAQRGGASYRYNNQKINFSVGANVQHATLEGLQYTPYAFNLQQSFTNALPEAMFDYKIAKGQNVRLNYRTATNAPSISQLQQVVDITNPLLLRTGNPNLVQDYSHNVNLRYGNTNTTTGRNVFVFANVGYTNDYIGSETIIPADDSIFAENVIIRRGSQLTRPVNLDGYWNTRAFLAGGLPLGIIKSNFNFHGGFNYRRTPSLVNGATNFSNNYAPNAGIMVSSNISEKLDFFVSYNGNYNIVRNTLQGQSDNSYFSHVASLRVNWLPIDRIVINTTVDHNLYSGLNQGFNQQFLLWNAFAGYKFLKDRSLEARVSVYDIMNQNRSIGREITDTYLEDSKTRVLTRYVMFTLSYTLRNFKGSATSSQGPSFQNEPPPPMINR